MATFEITEGAPGQGKSLYTARLTERTIKRNIKWFNRTGLKRVVWSNLKFSEAFEKQYEGYIQYWSDASELVKLNDVDIIWDERVKNMQISAKRGYCSMPRIRKTRTDWKNGNKP